MPFKAAHNYIVHCTPGSQGRYPNLDFSFIEIYEVTLVFYSIVCISGNWMRGFIKYSQR